MNNLNSQGDYNELNNSAHPRHENELKSLIPFRRNSESFNNEQNNQLNYENEYADGYYGAVNYGGDEKRMLQSFFATVRKHWLLILTFTFLITGAVIVYVAQKPDYYKAVARIQVNSEINPAAGSGEGGGAIIVNNPGSDPVYFSTQLQILEGTGLLRRVAKTLDLENNQSFLDPQQGRRLTVFQNVKRMFGLYQPPVPEQETSDIVRLGKNKLNLSGEKNLDPDSETEKYAPIVASLKNNLSVQPVKDSRTGSGETRLIEIEFTHQDAAVASKIVNAIGDAYVLQNLEQKIQSNASAGDFLQKRVAELQSEIRQNEERLINYSKINKIVSLDEGQNTVVQRFSDLNMKLGQAENDRIAAQTAYQAALQNEMRAATAEVRDPQVVTLETRLTELRQKLAQLKTEYTEEWYEVAETRKQIETIENRLLTIRKRASDIQIAALGEKLYETVAREKELRNSFDDQRSQVVRQNEAAINYKIIQQEIDTNKSLLNGLLQRSRENDVILNGTPNNVLVAERANLPESPIGPERSKNVLLAFIISLFAGGGLAFMLDWLNDSVHNSNEVESELGLPLLAAIPSAPVGLSKRLMPEKLMSLTRRSKHVKNAYNLEVFDKPEFSEAYLQLRTHLLLSTAGGAPQTLLVASGEEGEGKTMTAINLATSLAKTGEPILLIDADLRCPRIHLIKDLNNDCGLTTLLTAKHYDDNLVERAIQKNGCGNLHILTAGERTLNPANLLCSNEMQILLENLSKYYTHIVIDSPPILYFADGTIISTFVDAVLIIVREGISSRQTVLKARRTLLNVGARLVGMVINDVPMQWSKYGRYKHYQDGAEEFAAEDAIQGLHIG